MRGLSLYGLKLGIGWWLWTPQNNTWDVQLLHIWNCTRPIARGAGSPCPLAKAGDRFNVLHKGKQVWLYIFPVLFYNYAPKPSGTTDSYLAINLKYHKVFKLFLLAYLGGAATSRPGPRCKRPVERLARIYSSPTGLLKTIVGSVNKKRKKTYETARADLVT